MYFKLKCLKTFFLFKGCLTFVSAELDLYFNSFDQNWVRCDFARLKFLFIPRMFVRKTAPASVFKSIYKSSTSVKAVAVAQKRTVHRSVEQKRSSKIEVRHYLTNKPENGHRSSQKFIKQTF